MDAKSRAADLIVKFNSMKRTFEIIRFLKIFVAIILLFSIFLPFKSCTRYLDESNFKNLAPKDRPPKVTIYSEDGQNIEKEYYKVKNTIYILSADDWPLALAFIWPLLIFLLAKYRKIRTITWSTEPALAAAAAGFIFYGVIFCAEIGAYISFFSNILIFSFWIVDAVLLIYIRIKFGNLTTACTQTGVTLPLHTGW